jgi:uncharacterized protein with HEPN domain
MPSERDRAGLADILFNLDLAERFVSGLDYERFVDDMRTFYALTRCLEVISEASRRLSEDLKARHPEIPWRQSPDRETSAAMTTKTFCTA